MLVNLHVKNLALIEEADVNFEEGLNILTGETGAGKSILIGSITAALGNKINGDFIRKGAQYGLCELTFNVTGTKKISELKAMEVCDLEDGMVIISRKIFPNRTVLKVNGENRTISEVKAIASILIDIHGQHEHQSLLYKNNYLSIIDRYAAVKAQEIKEALKKEYAEYIRLKKSLLEYAMDTDELNREVSYIEYELGQIDDAAITDNEDIELEARFKKFNNSRKIMENVKRAYGILSDGDSSVSYMFGYIYRDISAAAEYDNDLSGIFSQVRELEDLINGLSADLSQYISDMEYDEEEYSLVESRLTLINDLKLKYGNTIDEIRKYYADRRKRLDNLLNYEENKNKITELLNASEEKVLILCRKLSDIRKEFAGHLSEDIEKALKELNFLDVSFEISVNKTESFSENGYDEIDFMISTNPGEDLKPLSRVASGGELSRIMLAIKTVLADKDDIEVLIFDEIDTGISGRTAQMVSLKLAEISRTHQVICITHLPQIAAMADAHFMIEKNVSDNKTATSIKFLSEDESVNELARLLGGVTITENVLKNAREMKDLAHNSKTTKII